MNSNPLTTWAESVAPFLGAVVVPCEDERDRPKLRHAAHRWEINIWQSWHEKGKVSLSIYPDTPGARAVVDSINVSLSRPVIHAGRDIRRRLIEPARPELVKHYNQESAKSAAAVDLNQKREQLAAALGIEHNGQNHNRYAFNSGPVVIDCNYDLEGSGYGGDHRATIRVHDWNAFLAIAKILGEDYRLAHPKK